VLQLQSGVEAEEASSRRRQRRRRLPRANRLSQSFRLRRSLCAAVFRKEYTEYTTKSGKKVLGVIPLNGERNLLLSIGNVVFVDSMQFLAASLDNLFKEMRNSGLDDFVHTTRHFGRNELFFKKGSYPYEYMTDASKFEETALPP